MKKTGAGVDVSLRLRKSERRKIRELADAGNEHAIACQAHVRTALERAPGSKGRRIAVRSAQRFARKALEEA